MLIDSGLIVDSLEEFVLGTTAVTIPAQCPASRDHGRLPNAATLVCENNCYLITYPKDCVTSQATLRRVWFTDSKGRGVYQLSIYASSQLSSSDTLQNPSIASSFIICVTRTEVRTLRIRLNVGPRMIPWRIVVGGNPSRVVYSSRFKKLFVGLSFNAVMDPAVCFERPRDNGRVSFSRIKIIDPEDSESEDDMVKEEEPFKALSNRPPDKDSFSAVVGKSGEKITALCEWSFVNGTQTWPLLLVSTLRENFGDQRGRIRMFSISTKREASGLKIEQRHVFRETSAVCAVAGYNDSTFVYCAGTTLFLQSIGTDKGRLRGISKIQTEMGSPGRSISVNESSIVVSTIEHSTKIFQLIQDTLRLVFSDGQARKSLDHLLLPSSLILTSSTDRKICGLSRPPQPTVSGELPLVFEATLPSIISCLHEATLQPWLQSNTKSKWPPILASAIDGGFYQLDVINEAEWKLLRFIQDMAEGDPMICPYNRLRSGEERTIANKGPRRRHVNGDILLRILQLGSEACEKLESLVNSQRTYENPRQVFLDLAKAALGPELEQTDLMKPILRHMQSILQPPL